MALTPQQIEHIKRLKKELEIDQRIGTAVSEQSHSRGHFVGVLPVSPDKGRAIVEETFNPIIKRVLEDLD